MVLISGNPTYRPRHNPVADKLSSKSKLSADGKKKRSNVKAKGGVDQFPEEQQIKAERRGQEEERQREGERQYRPIHPRSNKSRLSADGKKKRAAKDPVQVQLRYERQNEVEHKPLKCMTCSALVPGDR